MNFNSQKPFHGGDLVSFCRKYQKLESEVIDFSSNINPLGIPDRVRNLYPHLTEDLSRYPDSESSELCSEISKQFSLPLKNVMAGNGSIELLALAIKTLAPKRVVLLEPCFSEYRLLAQKEGILCVSIFLKEEEGFYLNPQRIFESIQPDDLLILGHPNNPTGTALTRQELRELAVEVKKRGAFILIDEAFSDWNPEISLAHEIQEESNFIVIRSLTKFYALAGIRSGFALGPKIYLDFMKNAQQTWSCNRLAEKLSVAAMEDEQFKAQTLEWFRQESKWFYESLAALEFLKIYPSLANFFLIRNLSNPGSWNQLPGFLGKRGIYVRSAQTFQGLDASYFRVALRLRKENEFLIAALKEWAQINKKEPTYA